MAIVKLKLMMLHVAEEATWVGPSFPVEGVLEQVAHQNHLQALEEDLTWVDVELTIQERLENCSCCGLSP